MKLHLYTGNSIKIIAEFAIISAWTDGVLSLYALQFINSNTSGIGYLTDMTFQMPIYMSWQHFLAGI
ncbi:MAG TPA: hypothetical protein HPP56_02605 [Nitrospirae bacterium]|nr:hypothetical protein [Nitrospirota bacterium]